MSPFPLRLRVRTLLRVVALVALVLGGGQMAWRAYVYGRLAREYAFMERNWRQMAVRDRADPARSRSVSAVYGLDIADYYAPLAAKYRRARWRPWARVAPDPPAPVYGKPPRG
jgi:hypothetical protein